MLYKRIYHSLLIVLEFVRFFLSARTIDEADSPQLFNFYVGIKSKSRDVFAKIEAYRKKLFNDPTSIRIEDYGAGSKFNSNSHRQIKSIARSAVSPQYKCHILFQIIEFLQPKTVLELGTSLGISALYIEKNSHVQHITTVDGDSTIQQYNLHNIRSEKINFVQSTFDGFLDQSVNEGHKYDCIILDGNHSYKPTLAYVDTCLKLLNPNGAIIIDDIYWSNEMKKAWKELLAINQFDLKLDLFFYGLLIKNDRIKEPIIAKLLPFSFRWKWGLFR